MAHEPHPAPLAFDLEIGRDPGGNTDWGQYIGDAVSMAQAGQVVRIVSHGKPVALLTPVPPERDGPPAPPQQ